MSKQTAEEKAHMEKQTEYFLYNIGFEHMNHLCQEVDQIAIKYADVEVPESLNNWFETFSDELNKKTEKAKRKIRFKRISRQAAVILLVILAALSVVTLSVEAFRVRFFNMLIDTRERFTELHFEENESNTDVANIEALPEDWEHYYPAYVPEGFTPKMVSEGKLNQYMKFSNEEGEEFNFFQGSISAGIQIDSEGARVWEIEVNGFEGFASEKDEIKFVVWHNHNQSFFISGTIDISELQKIAENITRK